MNRNRNGLKMFWFALLIVPAAASMIPAIGCTNKAPDIRIEKASAQVSPAMLGVASVFMNIVNSGGKDVLLSSKTDVKGTVTELHDIKDGKMVKVERIDVPSSGIGQLKSGSLHIMIFNLPKDLKPGSSIRLVLVFEKAGEMALTVAMESNMMHQMGHGGH
ncbi:MAG: hypothetical protein A2X57_04960 [Nitrospirae bacterium GWD2_57_8]|nr:MAG: hypothetical protein A2X57_04960 [Nitrospirae bacterium GWD2_57_8]